MDGKYICGLRSRGLINRRVFRLLVLCMINIGSGPKERENQSWLAPGNLLYQSLIATINNALGILNIHQPPGLYSSRKLKRRLLSHLSLARRVSSALNFHCWTNVSR